MVGPLLVGLTEIAFLVIFGWGTGLRETVLGLTFFAAAFFGGAFFRAGAVLTGLRRVAAEVDFTLALDAFRAGAFLPGERLTIGLGRADLPANARFFAEDAEEFCREAGREGDRFTPLTIGSLIRST